VSDVHNAASLGDETIATPVRKVEVPGITNFSRIDGAEQFATTYISSHRK
jgi:hypothetical protein